jgi:hypothetical protein
VRHRGVSLALTERKRGLGRLTWWRVGSIELHRVTEWVTEDAPQIAELLHSGDTLEIRINRVLTAVPRRIAMEWVFSEQSYLLGYVERTGGHPSRRSLRSTIARHRDEIELETREPWFFARHKARSNPSFDFEMRFVARATSAAPTYFEPEELTETRPHGGLIDGGFTRTTPPSAPTLRRRTSILIRTTSSSLHWEPASTLAPSTMRTRGTGASRLWAKPILNVVFDGVSDTVDHEMKILFRDSDDGDPRYYRFQTELNVGSDDMDNATATNLLALKQKAQEVIDLNDTALDKLCQELTMKVRNCDACRSASTKPVSVKTDPVGFRNSVRSLTDAPGWLLDSFPLP